MNRGTEVIEIPRTVREVYELIDLLHTWTLDNVPESEQAPAIEALEMGMRHLEINCPDDVLP